MPSLSNEQLLLLDNLIYMDGITNGQSVQEIVDMVQLKLDQGQKLNYGGLENDDWQNIIKAIKQEKILLNYSVTNYTSEGNGMRAAAFVDNPSTPSDVNVVFRGTNGDYEWHDNGAGGYLSDTIQQQRAADYINNLPATYGNSMTVTGHSKGGNKAQYVTIVTDRIDRCVSLDGQGFSPEFHKKYTDEIARKKDMITSISAEADYVNCLMIPIAGTIIYIDTVKQEFIANHYPHIIFKYDIEGKAQLRDVTEQAPLSKAINEYTMYIISNVEDPERSFALDGLLALMESGEGSKESIIQTILAAGIAVGHLDDFAFDYIAEHYGVGTEVAITYLAALAYPFLFTDDYLEALKDGAVALYEAIVDMGKKIVGKLKELGEKAEKFEIAVAKAVQDFADRVKTWLNKNVNPGYKYANAHPLVKVDTQNLRNYAQRLKVVNKRLNSLDRSLDSLYTNVGLLDLWNLLQADLMTSESWRIKQCISYLEETAEDFESVERKIINSLG